MEDRSGMIIDAYRRADFARRLHLFLDYADLREEFMEIERGEMKSGGVDLSRAKLSPEPAPAGNLFRRLAGVLNALL